MAKEGGAAVHITPIVRKHRQVDAGMQFALLNSDRWLLGCSFLYSPQIGACWDAACFLYSPQFLTPDHGMMSLTSTVVFLIK